MEFIEAMGNQPPEVSELWRDEQEIRLSEGEDRTKGHKEPLK